jgi:hypothetical protein
LPGTTLLRIPTEIDSIGSQEKRLAGVTAVNTRDTQRRNDSRTMETKIKSLAPSRKATKHRRKRRNQPQRAPVEFEASIGAELAGDAKHRLVSLLHDMWWPVVSFLVH